MHHSPIHSKMVAFYQLMLENPTLIMIFAPHLNLHVPNSVDYLISSSLTIIADLDQYQMLPTLQNLHHIYLMCMHAGGSYKFSRGTELEYVQFFFIKAYCLSHIAKVIPSFIVGKRPCIGLHIEMTKPRLIFVIALASK